MGDRRPGRGDVGTHSARRGAGPRRYAGGVERITEIVGRLVLAGGVVSGRVTVEDGWIARVEELPGDDAANSRPLIAPGFIDVHVHGWGGHDATGDADALSGMARALLRRGVTSFLPTAPTLPEAAIERFAEHGPALDPRRAVATAPRRSGSTWRAPSSPPARRGAHDAALLRTPASIDPAILDAALDGLRVITVAPELPGALELIARLADEGIVASLGHSDATLDAGPRGLRRGRDRHDPPVQRHDRRRPPVARPRGRGAGRPTPRGWSSSPTATTSTRRCGR